MTFGLLTLLVPLTVSQPPMPPVPPALPVAPVLAARVLAPDGVRVTAYPGTPAARMFDAPALLAFRPGYVYRLELTNLPYRPAQRLYPEVEVRGTLVPRPGMKYMDYPVPIAFSGEDIERVLNGAVVTKVIYLEDPEKAIPAEALPNAPIEVTTDSESESVDAAVANGRLVAIVRLGDRALSAAELQATAIPGTILLPGEQRLAAPPVPPVLPWFACPLFDPIMGPKLAVEECTLDGGDRGARLGIGPNGKLGGLDATDVGVEFSIAGKRKVTSSNVVCICVPRFVVQRSEIAPIGLRLAFGPSIGHHVTAREEFRVRNIPMAEVGREKPIGTEARLRPMAYVEAGGPTLLVSATRPNIVGQVEGVLVTGAVVEPEQITAYPGICPLSVTKSVDPPGPVQQGDVIVITIRYVNTGNKPVTDIVLSDSLSGRLEYVAGSALSDKAATFSSAENEVGSVVVRWQFPGKVLPGQSGLVKFQVKVR